ncbi:electron transport complex subunit RsxB [Pseudomonas sp. GD03842]|uniref:electron transport complex subunit RsxB n=1 Tax=unclassified Pseudomonas TaxID=196821 RepID=UPI000D33E383|nr:MULTISPECIES: electron transport complex subunit RsxB [unclassified Pseudomonas]MDH0748614.1 electron transport complex subunit RsxB [Pseudomonas sp. GD03842]RAU43322.1 electron transport complex subunit RsxB [Pseudomonas sp. RIT 409]RAU50365.1 electron transport complex subunit RsxB [Pseudomonas sp. RIT 412]
MNLIQRIDALLPQTQCGKCGHPGCKPYAEGIASGEAINKCPPGGDETIAALADLLNVPALPLDTERGHAPSQVAFIREEECIGCTKCIQACPVDAIVGAAKWMHTVIASECTGCDLCVAPCPVDCIDMLPLSSPTLIPIVGGLAFDDAQRVARAARRGQARQRFEARNVRLHREELQRQSERLARQQASKTSANTSDPVQAALGRVRVHNAADDAALKQARVDVNMSRAQLNRSLKAFGHPPTAEQAAQLVTLQRQFEEAERALALLLSEITPDNPPSPPPVSASSAGQPDKAAINRAKIQLATRRAALKKAQTNAAPAEQLAALNSEVSDAEQALHALEAMST